MSKEINLGGRPPKWRAGKTTTIRVPEAYAKELLTLAQEWDKKGMEVMLQNP
jgi:hypothetical protein